MSQTITIDPVTRLEGHGKITIQLNGQGEVENAHFHVTQVRGFERFSEGRPFYEMPSLMARICGICRCRISSRPPRPARPSCRCAFRTPRRSCGGC